jgi:hypothetical protein
MRKHITLSLLTILSFSAGVGQQFAAEALLPPIDASGFYKVPLGPSLLNFSSRGQANIRVIDEDERPVPHIVEVAEVLEKTEFVHYRIIAHDHAPGCCTTLILENQRQEPISNFYLRITNADVTKTAVLLGSTDKVNWYAVKDRFVLSNIIGDGTAEVRVVDFPSSTYPFLKIVLDDSTTAPIRIESAGYYRRHLEKPLYVSLTGLKYRQLDSLRSTRVIIEFDTATWVDRIRVSSTGFPFYSRQAQLYLIGEDTEKRTTRKRNLDPLVRQEVFTHEHPTEFILGELRAKKVILEIENGDNPPLTVESVNAFQLQRHLVVYLERGKRYKVRFGPMTMQPPQYDLANFRRNIPLELPALIPNPVTKAAQNASAEGTVFSSHFMWAAIVAIVAILGFLSYRMIKERSEPV